ncbi:MAG: hypothetical protein IJ333_01420, partial [Clostridia bacterium]|nr:hypothetical protein [Clostridia bacterium]
TWGNNRLIFSYDEKGLPLSFYYRNSSGTSIKYYYVLNAQGDVVQLRNQNNAIVARYYYDAWGNLLQVVNSAGTAVTSTSHIGLINPLRYRGYYFDSETGFYYLQSRYYDPAIRRFISVDDQISNAGGEILGYNMFAYCVNNPVNMSDPTGNWPKWATIAIGAVAAVAAVAVTVATLGAAAPAAACTLTSVGMYLGASYGVAHAVAIGAVAATTVAAAAYAGDIAYSAVTGDSILLDTVFQGNSEAYNAGLALTSIATGGMAELAAQSPGVCFVAGTAILTAYGYKPIEDIHAGDIVWAKNPETGEKETKKVVQTFDNETDELIHVYVNGEEITTTPEHPFYIPNKGWIQAIHLRAGDILLQQNGRFVVVEKIQHEILESPIKVYNFEVEDFHTYYVGECAVLVHNSCSKKPTSPNQMQKQVERGQAPKTVIRVDNPKIPNQLPHVHFRDGTSLNIDGSVHDSMNGIHSLTNSERIWLFENGWGRE